MICQIEKKGISATLTSKLSVLILISMLFILTEVSGAAMKQKVFSTPDEAVKTAISAARNNDDKEMLSIFGSSARDLIFSGDAVADKQRRMNFLQLYDEKNRLVAEKDRYVLVVGKHDWPFPVPLAKKGDAWFFDTDKGREEILNRRIGENELSTIQSMLAIVDAQREYAMASIKSKGAPEYAQKLMSDTGKQNGLYWETKDGEKPSPLGPVIAKARKEGYAKKKSGDKPSPFHGYYFRIVHAQGKNAAGGAHNYVVRGKMVGGFAVIAYPAVYGNVGVMTFIVNHDGVVYQKDLGKNTAKIAEAMKTYDPGSGWKKVADGKKQQDGM